MSVYFGLFVYKNNPVCVWVCVCVCECVCVCTCSLRIKNHKQTKLSFHTPGQGFALLDNELAADLCAAIFSGTCILLTHQQLKNDTWTGEEGSCGDVGVACVSLGR